MLPKGYTDRTDSPDEFSVKRASRAEHVHDQ